MSTHIVRRLESGLAVDSRLPTPLYHQIYVILRERIADGSVGAGSNLPGEQELARRYGVSRVTAKRALDELAAEGLVVRERGRGTRVRAAPPTPPLRASIEGLLENLTVMGIKTKVVLLEFGYAPASPEVAAALACSIGATVQRAVRIRRIDGEPFSHLTTYVPEAIGRSYTRRDLAAKPFLSLVARSGIKVSRADQVISARLADAPVAQHLGVEIGSALLKITRIVRGQRGRPVEFITGLYRPDRYQYAMSLSGSEDGRHTIWHAEPPQVTPRRRLNKRRREP
ncbi:MAG: GntR family transcriptional regulator [Stellaceae bacterium]